MNPGQNEARADDTGFSPAAAISQIGIAASTLVANLFDNVAQLVDGIQDDTRVVREDLRRCYEVAGATARDLVRATPRFARITRDVLQIAAGYRLHATLKVDASSEMFAADLARQLSDAALGRLHRDGAERLLRLCLDLRGGILKLGQFISTRRDLLPPAYVEQLSQLQDRVPPVDTEDILVRIEDELLRDVDDCFESFDRDCVAAASLAQVHAATLANGIKVAVKVQVPKIEEVIDTDIAALRLVAPVIRDLLPAADVDTVVCELTQALLRELDYRAEAESALEFARCFDGDPDIIVPGIHLEQSAERVLTLDFIEGERLTDYLEECESRGEAGRADLDRILTILIRSFCAQVLVHGIFHADPHPGNFLVVRGPEGPRLAILDFGNVQRFTWERRRDYAQLGLAILTRDSNRVAELLGSLGFRSRDTDSGGLVKFADLLLEPFRPDVDIYSVNPKERIEQVMELTRTNPIVQIPGDFVQLGRVFGSLGGLVMRYKPRVNLSELLLPSLMAAMH